MSVSSLARRLLAGRAGQLDYLTVASKINSVTGSTLELKTVLNAAASELAGALQAVRCAILLHDNGTTRLIADHSTAAIKQLSRERLAQVDQEITRGMDAETSLIEIANAAQDPKLSALLPRVLNGHTPSLRLSSVLVAPLVIQACRVGSVIVYRSKARKFSTREKQVTQAITSNLSLTIQQIRSQEMAEGVAAREALTDRLLASIRTADNEAAILEVAAESLGAALGVSRAVIYDDGVASGRNSNSDAAPVLTARAEYRANALIPSLKGCGLDIDGSPLTEQLSGGEPIIIADTNDSHPVVRAIGVRLGVRAMALAPISYRGRMRAVLTLEQFGQARNFSQEELALIRLVTAQTAVALQQAELSREAKEAGLRERIISRISSAIHSSLDPEAVLQAIVTELGSALSVCRCRMALLPSPLPERVPISHEYVADCCSERKALEQAVSVSGNIHLQAVLASPRPIATDDVMTDPLFAPYRESMAQSSIKSVLATAIRLGGRPIGGLSLHHSERQHRWTDWEIALVQSVAEQAAVAIRQAELYREARESATRATLVNQIVAAIRRSLDLKETLQVAVQELGRALGADRTYFRQLAADELKIVAEHLSRPDYSLSHINASVVDYITTYLMETRRTLIIDDVRAFAAAHPDVASTVAIWKQEPINRSQIVCPIFINDQFWGALSIGQVRNTRKWTSHDIALVEVVAAQIEVAVSHSHLFEETKRAAQLEALISHIIHGINQSNRLDEIFPIVARELGEHLEADRLVIAKHDPEAELWTIECAYSNGEVRQPGTTYDSKEFANLELVSNGGVIACNDVETDPRFVRYLERFIRPAGTRAFIAVPLEYIGGYRLAIAAIMVSGPRIWTSDEIEVIRAAADQMMIALERAELFEQVSRGKREWESTFDSLSDGVLIFDQNGLLRRVNAAGAAFEGADAPALIGRRCCTLMQGIEGETCRVAEVIRTGRPVTFELVPERLARPVLVTISPLTRDTGVVDSGRNSAGPVRGAVCIVRDLSELRAAEAVAREQRSFLVKLIEHANDAIFALSPEGRFIWFNEQLTRLSGCSREELNASDYRQFVRPDEKKLVVERFAGALGGQAQTFEMHGIRKTGEARLLLITYTPIYDEGRVTSVLSIARDITEDRLASERAAQADKLRALGQLASGVAHNFNNILAAILGHAQLIKRDCREDRMIQGVDIIERAALDGAQTVKRIQGFGLKQDGSIYESVDVNQIVQDSTHLTRARWRDEAQARGIRYDVEVELQPAPPAIGSPSELREVFVNLILNALDAMPQGGKLRITTEVKDSVVQSHFSDDGIGMSRDIRDHIFEPFFTTKGASGMGLGLAVSYSIIERHGGRIEVSSDPGRGSTFTVTLPLAHNSLEDAHAVRAVPVKERVSVMVIDDDERVRDALAGMLALAGHRTRQAASGSEALKLMEQEYFDLVFTDLSMPDMDGWAVSAKIRRRWPDTRIVLITGYAVPPETIRSHRDLVNAVIFKPLRFEDISTTLNQVLA